MIVQYQYEDQIYTLNLERQPDGSVIATIGESIYHLNVETRSANSLILRNTSAQQHIVHIAKAGQERYVHIHGKAITFMIPDKGRSQRHKKAAGDLTAQMPGQVREVTVGNGDFVDKGQTLIILEAMKMEMRISAPESGVIKAVHVHPGDVVERHQRLIELVPRGD